MRFAIHIDPELCKGCELCLAACQRSVLRMSADVDQTGYRRAQVEKPENCVGCRRCSDICPDAAIEIMREADGQAPDASATAEDQEKR